MKTPIALGALMLSNVAHANIELELLDWVIINDTVMGGVSQSRLLVEQSSVVFKGNVSLANNGGFASVRAPYSFENVSIDTLRFKVRGDGKQYQLRLRVDEYYDGPSFVYRFNTQKNEEQTFSLTERDFTLMFRGRTIESDYQLKFNDVRAIGFMIGAKQKGEFELNIQQISAQQKI